MLKKKRTGQSQSNNINYLTSAPTCGVREKMRTLYKAIEMCSPWPKKKCQTNINVQLKYYV